MTLTISDGEVEREFTGDAEAVLMLLCFAADRGCARIVARESFVRPVAYAALDLVEIRNAGAFCNDASCDSCWNLLARREGRPVRVVRRSGREAAP